MTTHSSTLAWKISWTEESGEGYSHRVTGSQDHRVGHDWACSGLLHYVISWHNSSVWKVLLLSFDRWEHWNSERLSNLSKVTQQIISRNGLPAFSVITLYLPFPLQCSCLENPRDRGAWWAAVSGVTQSRTWLKRLGSSSPNLMFVKTLRVIFLNSWMWEVLNFGSAL